MVVAAARAAMMTARRAGIGMCAGVCLDFSGKRREFLVHVFVAAFRARRRGVVEPPMEMAEDLTAFLTFVFVDWHFPYLKLYMQKNNPNYANFKLNTEIFTMFLPYLHNSLAKTIMVLHNQPQKMPIICGDDRRKCR